MLTLYNLSCGCVDDRPSSADSALPNITPRHIVDVLLSWQPYRWNSKLAAREELSSNLPNYYPVVPYIPAIRNK